MSEQVEDHEKAPETLTTIKQQAMARIRFKTIIWVQAVIYIRILALRATITATRPIIATFMLKAAVVNLSNLISSSK